MPHTPIESKAAERELGRASASQLRDGSAPAAVEQPLDASRPLWTDKTSSPASERAEQGSTYAGIIAMQGGRSNGKAVALRP